MSLVLRADDRLAGLDPADLAERYGTPCYVYDLDVIDRQVGALRSVLPGPADIAFALKSNPALAIVTYLATNGIGADVASAGELATALRAGFAPGSIVMTGPGKRDDELEAAVRAGIRAITVESPGELSRLERIAARLGRRQPVMLRAATAAAGRHERVRLVGDACAGKFGMDEGDLVRAGRSAVASPHLRFVGLHAFGASNVLDAAALVDHVAATGRTAAALARAAGTPLAIVDAGGGLGIPYADDETPLDLHALGRGLAGVLAGWSRDPFLADARLLLEPGRFLVGPAGAYVACVIDTKSVAGARVAILDGGVHHVLRPALVGQEHRLRVLSTTAERGPRQPVTVAGPLCSGLDVLSRDAVLPPLEVGDLVAVLDVGAYGFTESMPYFLSHPMPAEVIARDGRAELIRPRREPSTWLDEQVVPGLVTDAVSSRPVRP